MSDRHYSPRKYLVEGKTIAADGREISIRKVVLAHDKIAANVVAFAQLCQMYPDDNLEPVQGSWKALRIAQNSWGA